MLLYRHCGKFALVARAAVLTIAVCTAFPQKVCTEPPLKKVTFVTQWMPQAQFAGYYVAREKGIYSKYGMEVSILPGGPKDIPSRLIREGKADFGSMFLSTALVEREGGTPLVNLAQIVQKSSFMLVAEKSRGIHIAADLNGKRVGLWSNEYRVQALAWFKKHQIAPVIVPQFFSVNLFLMGGVDAISAMRYNEYHMLYQYGLEPEELTVFSMEKDGLDFPEDGLYCLEDTYLRDPEAACAFAAASLEGWQYAFDHPEEAHRIVMRQIQEKRIPNSRTHQKWMLYQIEKIIRPAMANSRPGRLDPSDYERVGRALKESGFIHEVAEFSTFYKACSPLP